jgi:anti-sigma factor RsiW
VCLDDRLMDCHRFRESHLAYLDDTLPGEAMARVRQHLTECAACAALDARVRRAVMLVRNHAPEIAPSADFRLRLAARLASHGGAAVAADARDAFLTPPSSARWRRGPLWLAVAAGLGVVTTSVVVARGGGPREPQLPPALAVAPPLHIVPIRPVRFPAASPPAVGASWSVIRVGGDDLAGAGGLLPAAAMSRGTAVEFLLTTGR